jgi:hypothetical protein
LGVAERSCQLHCAKQIDIDAVSLCVRLDSYNVKGQGQIVTQ